MVSKSRVIEVNPPGEPVRVTREDLWQGLLLKAENALPFVRSMSKCEVVARDDDGLLRDIEIDGAPFQERVTFVQQRQVKFVRTEGHILGTILNDIEEDEQGRLLLRFTFAMELEDVAPGSREEQDYEQLMEDRYVQAVDQTLAAVRRIVTERSAA